MTSQLRLHASDMRNQATLTPPELSRPLSVVLLTTALVTTGPSYGFSMLNSTESVHHLHGQKVALSSHRPSSAAASQESPVASRASLATAAFVSVLCFPLRRARGLSFRANPSSSARRLQQVRAHRTHQPTKFTVGTRIKVVATNIEFWHVPGLKGKSYNPEGHEGLVESIVEGEHLTANRPILVKLTKASESITDSFKAFRAHFSDDELASLDEDLASSEAAAESSSESSSCRGDLGDSSAFIVPESVKFQEADTDSRWKINLLYDGKCSSCMKQVEFLTKRMDENPEYAGLVRLTDLHAEDYDPEKCGGVIFEDGMRHIHAVTRDGEVITGMDVFRRVYSIVGMEWVYTITTLPIVGQFFDWAYDRLAEYRLTLIGREDILQKVHDHQKKIEELSTTECDVECEVDWDHPEFYAAPAVAKAQT